MTATVQSKEETPDLPDHDQLHDRLVAALAAANETVLATVLADARTADLAESFDLLADEDRSRIIFALPPHAAAEVVVMLDEAVRGDVVDDLDTESLTELLSELPPDDAADVLGELSDDEVGEILENLEDDQSEKIEDLLEYGEETAGGIMTPDVVAVPLDATVGDAVEYVRQASYEEDLHEIYTIDGDGCPVGVVPLRRLVVNPTSRRLVHIFDEDPLTVSVADDQETVVQLIRKYDVSEAAVVDEHGRLVGRITHDDALDVAEEEAAEDLYRMAGTDPSELETSSTFHAARIRLSWLLPCMLGMLLSATVMKISQPQFDVVLWASLSLFVPMIGAMGGNSGIQISTVIVRGFATGDRGSTTFSHVLDREGRIVLAMAPICGVVAWLLVRLFFPMLRAVGAASMATDYVPRLSYAVGAAMAVAIFTAGALGIGLPFMFRRLGIDPAMASGPLVTTMNDVVSVAIYMILAMLIIGASM